MRDRIKFLILIILIMTFIQFAACSKISQNPNAKQQSSQSEQQSESNKAPSDLVELENNIETIVNTLGGPAVQANKETQQGRQSDSSGQKKQDSSNYQTGSSSKEEGENGQQNQTSGTAQKTQSIQDPMEKVIAITNTMHYQWNNLLPVVTKKGAKNELISNFDDALNSLSNIVSTKNKTNTLMAASYLYAYIPDFYSLFEQKPSPEIKRIRYYSRNVTLHSLTANWSQVDLDIANLKSIWSTYRKTLSKEQQDMASQLDVSIYELEKVAKAKNQHLTNIKGRVAFANIEALEKAAVKKSKGTQSSGGQSESQSSGGQSGSQQSSGGQSGGGQSSVYGYIKQLFDKLLKK